MGYQLCSIVSRAPDRSCAVSAGRRMVLVHDSKLTVNDPNPEASHRPNTVRLWPTELGHLVQDLHATTDSATRPPRDRARSRSPRIDVYRKHAFSTRAWRWALVHEDPAGVRRFGLHFS